MSSKLNELQNATVGMTVGVIEVGYQGLLLFAIGSACSVS